MKLRQLLIAFMLLLLPLPVFATSEPVFNPTIYENAGEPAGDIGVPPQVAGIAPWSYSFTFANLASQILFGVTSASFQLAHTTKTINDMVLGKTMEWAGVWLMPKVLQDTYLKLDTKIQPMTGNHVQCFYDEIGGQRHTPDERIFKTPWMGGNTLGGGTELLYTTWSKGNLSLPNLNLYGTLKIEHVKPDNGLPCFTQDEGTEIGLYPESDTEQLYLGTDQAQFTAELFCGESEKAKFLDCQAANEDLPPEEQEDCSLTCGDKAHTVYSTNLSRGIVINERLGRGEDGVCQGFTCAFIPKPIVADKKHGINTQDHTLVLPPIITDDVTTETSVYYMEASLRQHTDIMKCGNTAKGAPGYDAKKCTDFKINLTGNEENTLAGIRNDQDAIEKREAAQCTTNKSISSSVSKSGLDEAITNAAAWAKIPSCVLTGVAEIEGAMEEMAQNTCVPNQCGAAGPFQISVGVDSCGQTDCKSCGPSWADGSRTCNNETWALETAGGTAADACNVNVAAKAAAAVVEGKANSFGVPFDADASSFNSADSSLKQTIITATDAYYGVTTPIPRLGNLSYGEYVYQTCTGTPVTHCDHTFPYSCP